MVLTSTHLPVRGAVAASPPRCPHRHWQGAQQHTHSSLPPRRRTAHLFTRPRHSVVTAASADEPDVAVFRFTLGLKWLDDVVIPQVLALVGAALLCVNHATAMGDLFTPAPSVETRIEMIAVAVAAACLTLPAIDARLNSEESVGASPDGSSGRQVFHFSSTVRESTKQELGWASYALLSNTKAKLCLIVRDGTLTCARGAVLDTAASSEPQLLASLAAVVQRPVEDAQRQGSQLYVSDFTDKTWLLGTGSLLIQPLGSNGALALFSPAKNAFGRKSMAWASAIAAKLAGAGGE